MQEKDQHNVVRQLLWEKQLLQCRIQMLEAAIDVMKEALVRVGAINKQHVDIGQSLTY